jgi:serine/threonine protein kinase
MPPEAAAHLPPEESFEGRTVGGKYLVGPLIGSGGMGTVWLGQHIQLGTRVAIKFIRPQFAERADARRRFEIEARAAARFSTTTVTALLLLLTNNALVSPTRSPTRGEDCVALRT